MTRLDRINRQLSTLSSPRTWLGALLIAPVDAAAITLAVAAGSLATTPFPDFVAVGPFVLTAVILLVLTGSVRRRLLAPVRDWTAGATTRGGADESETASDGPHTDPRGVLSHVRRGPETGWWRTESSVAVVTAGLWAALWTVVLAVWTASRYLAYTKGSVEPTHPAAVVVAFASVGLLAGVVGASLGELTGAGAGPRALLATLRTRPLAAGGRVLAVGLPAVATGLIAFLALVETSYYQYWKAPDLPVLFVVTALVACVTRGVGVAFRADEDSPPPTTGPPIPWGRLTVVALVVVSLFAGASAVRVADVGFSPVDEPQALPDDPRSAFRTATANSMGQDHRTVVETAVRAPGDSTTERTRSVYGVDLTDRQYMVVFQTDGLAGYFGEGVKARRFGNRTGVSVDESDGIWTGTLGWVRDDWAAVATSPGAYLAESSLQGTPDGYHPTAVSNWHVVARNDSTLVVGLNGTAVGDAVSYLPGTDDERSALADNATVRATLDRESGTLRRVAVEATVLEVEEGNRTLQRHVLIRYRYERVGDYDLQRPAAVGHRRAVEWLWDAVYY